MTAGYRPDHWDAVRTGEREEEDQEPYCRECGSENLAYVEQYADSREYKCRMHGVYQRNGVVMAKGSTLSLVATARAALAKVGR